MITALGPYVPIEHWPDLIRAHIAAAYAEKANRAADRIREAARAAPCRCRLPHGLANDGRCSRCWGWLG